MGEVKVKGGQGVGLLPTGLTSLREEEGRQHAAAFPIHRRKAMRGHSDVANYKTERSYQEQILPVK